jgi:hypothetical protein
MLLARNGLCIGKKKCYVRSRTSGANSYEAAEGIKYEN